MVRLLRCRTARVRLIALGTLVLLGVACGATATPVAPAVPATATAPAAQVTPTATHTQPASVGISFSKDLQPIFATNCNRCHSGNSVRAGFSLATYATTMKGGNGGVAVVAGQPEKSPLYTLVRRGEMPLGEGPLSERDAQKIYDWIKAGAPDN